VIQHFSLNEKYFRDCQLILNAPCIPYEEFAYTLRILTVGGLFEGTNPEPKID